MRICLLIILFFFQIQLYAQINNIRIDKYNLAHNSALLSNVILQVFGKKKIEKWLNEDRNFLLFVWIDKKGNLQDSLPIRVYKSCYLNQFEIDSIINYIKLKNIKFPCCIENDTYIGFNRINQLLNKDRYYINISFPGNGYYNELLLHNDSISSRLKNFQSSIMKYSLKTIREIIINNDVIIEGNNQISKGQMSIYNDSIFFDLFDELNFMYYNIPLNGISYIKNLVKHDSHLYEIKLFLKDIPTKCSSLSKEDIRYLIKMLGIAYQHKYQRLDFFTSLCFNRKN